MPAHSRKYSLNESFFSIWSPEMAYVLGFWYADGYMKHDRSYRVIFYSMDSEILDKINYVAGSNAKLYRYYKNNKPIGCYTLTLHSKQLYLDLKKHGGSRANSKTITFPYIPNKHITDFIRGYFDGDGSVHVIRYEATKNGKVYSEIRSNFTSGSVKFLEELRLILSNKLDLPQRVIGQYGPHQFKLGYGQKNTHKLMAFMYYPDHTISLRRKAVYLKKFPHQT